MEAKKKNFLLQELFENKKLKTLVSFEYRSILARGLNLELFFHKIMSGSIDTYDSQLMFVSLNLSRKYLEAPTSSFGREHFDLNSEIFCHSIYKI
ncbi:hypothetical protein BpHYR1_024182 [Brachionus plicatilis]|uniref:Uncharacterized protein n=1 Tax=Brachionus plicatilis TaxID=10195 RepID=A0A3M7SL85_BRAPC|nr:hypothetical protein BpHYR1_024182 [Brachionus plicatilis]